MTEVKWEELPRAEYLKGPIFTRRVYAEGDIKSLSEAVKMAIRHLQARFPGLYTPRSTADLASTPVDPVHMTERLSEEDSASAAVALDDTAAARVGWTHLGSPTPVDREHTLAPLVLQVRGTSSMSTKTATLEELSKDAPDRREGNMPGRANTAPARNPLAAGTKIGSGNGGSGGGRGGGC